MRSPVAFAAMRQVLSWRFVATIAALVGLTAIVYLAFGNRQSVAQVVQQRRCRPAAPTSSR